MSFDWLKRYMPRSLYARAALILILPVVTILLIVSFTFIRRHLEDVTTQMTLTLGREVEVVLSRIDSTADREAAFRAAAPFLAAFQMRLTPVAAAEIPSADRMRWYDFSARVVRATLLKVLDPAPYAMDFPETKRIRLYLPSRHGPLELDFNRRRVTVAAPHQLILTMLFFGILMTVIAFLYMRGQLRPITRLAAAAQAFGRGRTVPYAPSGALEVRAAGGAFLDMRARIERQIEQRTMLLSGVSHDLRTPLTRMKLGLAMIDPEEAEPLLRDVDEMQRLIDAFLDFTRGAGEGEAERVDVPRLVAEIVADNARAGLAVALGRTEVEGGPEAMLRRTAIRRALENLIANATRYGTRAVVSLAMTPKSLRIRVEDDGPGIPEARRAEATRPFTRLDPARNQDLGGGVGLGLAIVNDIARAHGGTLRLGDSEALGGLQADLVIAR